MRTTGHLIEKRGKWYAVINLYDIDGKRHEKWKSLDLEAKKAAGEDVDDSALNSFTLKVEFTPDHTVDQWMKIPAGVSDEMIKEAVESGEILAARDGYFCAQRTEWKCVDGKYYYDTKQHREVFGEVQSSWDELVCEDGLIKFGGGSMMIRKD